MSQASPALSLTALIPIYLSICPSMYRMCILQSLFNLVGMPCWETTTIMATKPPRLNIPVSASDGICPLTITHRYSTCDYARITNYTQMTRFPWKGEGMERGHQCRVHLIIIVGAAKLISPSHRTCY